jgi:D-serine deaminase-like pyridoxal phosphate-dependent protein
VQSTVLGPWAKSLPAASWGLTTAEFLDTSPRLSQFATPLLTIARSATESNVALMAQWLATRGLEIAPHGKTTMAPRMWQQLLDAGAWGITLATPWQVQFARSVGIQRIVLANEIVDPVALAWLGAEVADDSFQFTCWADSVEAVDAMRAGLTRAARPVDVLVELGAAGGRTGARSLEQALAVAAAIEAAPELRLAGLGGYEGSLGHDRSATAIANVERYLDDLVELHDRITWPTTPIVTAGGSAYFDLVAERLAPLVGIATVVLRSGAYQVHDDGFYRGITPLAGLRSAMHGWARVVSRPEPDLAILDGGKRDFPYDLDLPVSSYGALAKLNDQHGFLPIDGDGPAVGEVLRLELSHPCTAFDKWRLIPVINDDDDPLVVDLVQTYF